MRSVLAPANLDTKFVKSHQIKPNIADLGLNLYISILKLGISKGPSTSDPVTFNLKVTQIEVISINLSTFLGCSPKNATILLTPARHI